MAKEYIEREALRKFLEDNHDDKDWLVNQYNADWIYSWLESQPTADVVEVVRCKDCVHMTEHFGARFCEVWAMFNGEGDDDFCNYGERKD